MALFRIGYTGQFGPRFVARGSEFNPNDFGNTTLWLKPGEVDSSLDAGLASEWADTSGEGNDSTQSSDVAKLANSSSGFVRSYSNRNSGGKWLNTPQVITSNSFTFFVVACMQYPYDTSDPYRTMIGFGDSADADGGVFAIRYDLQKIALYLAKTGGGYDSYDGTGALTFPNSTQFKVFEVVSDGVNLSVYCDGVLDNTISVGATLAFTGKLTVSRNSARYFSGGIRAVLVYDEALDSTNRTAVRAEMTKLANSIPSPSWYFPSWTNPSTGALEGVLTWDNGMVGAKVPTTFSPASVKGTGDYAIIKRGSTYFMCYSNTRTYLDNTPNFGVATSSDLTTWTEIAIVDCSGVSGPSYHCGAPEWFVDDDDSVGVMLHGLSSDGSSRQFMVVRPTNPGMTTWGTPQSVTWTSQPVDIIDAFPFKNGSNFAILFGNGGLLEIAEASSRLGPYTTTKSGDWAGWGGGIEGGSFVLKNGVLTMVGDHFGDGGLGLEFSTSPNGTVNGPWSELRPVAFQMNGDDYPRHCTPILI